MGLAEALAIELERDYIEYKLSKQKVSPVLSNRASTLAFPCDRFNYLERTAWNEKALPDFKLAAIFDEGHHQEEALITDLRAMGYKVIRGQVSLVWPEYNITGRIDFELARGHLGPFITDAKSVSAHNFETIRSLEDMFNHKAYYVRMWPGQLSLYLWMKAEREEESEGLFILKNKQTGEIRPIPANIDSLNPGYTTSLLEKAKRINEYVSRGISPEPNISDEWCPSCGYLYVCLPGKDLGLGMVLLEEPELEKILDEWWEMRPYKSRAEELWETIKEKVRGVTYAKVGKYIIQGKEIERKGYEVKPSKYWKPEIVRVGE